ncbi:unnamed protein product [Allacma fusca]|uniref:DUF4430 domain-containing protein n=1 Tax=Allacma fusca TaxID=39272 RepID=A0A8J2JPG3_9HEXA|nr:unnamed protein product [Allacma fusca]
MIFMNTGRAHLSCNQYSFYHMNHTNTGERYVHVHPNNSYILSYIRHSDSGARNEMQSAITVLFACLLGLALTEDVGYHVWNHPIPEKSVGNPGQTFSVAKGKTFGDVMDLAAERNPVGYGFNFTQYDFGRLITSIGNVSHDPGNDLYWMLYELNAEPNVKNPPDQRNLTEYGVDGMIIEKNAIFLFWLTDTGHASRK